MPIVSPILLIMVTTLFIGEWYGRRDALANASVGSAAIQRGLPHRQ
jgi:hypothetical protein